MKRADEERLMRYFDGEADLAEAREVERWVEGSAEARALLADFECSRGLLRTAFTERADRAETIADHVMARVPVDGRGRGSQRASVASFSPGRKRGWLSWGPAAGLAFAAAASFLLHWRHEIVVSEPVRAPSSAAPVRAVAAAPIAPEEAAQVAPSKADGDEGASIESVDFGTEGGSIFVVSSGPEETPVVWLMDEPSPTRRRMKPL